MAPRTDKNMAIDYKELYDSIYSEFPNYGDLNHGKGCAERVNEYDLNAVLELGCGNKAWLGMIDADKKVGVDVASKEADYSLDITKGLPFKDGEFDLIGCFDVMEHLAESDIDYTLSEMRRVAPRAVFSISYQMSNYGRTHDFDLHVTIKDERWWLDKLEKAGYRFSFKHLNKYLFCVAS